MLARVPERRLAPEVERERNTIMPLERLTIRTGDGECPSYLFTPAKGDGPWPAAVVYMDAGGIRPTLMDMAQRLADASYVVLVPDLFYRYGPYGPFVPKQVFAGDFRAVLGPLMATTNNLKAAQDTGALLAYLDTRSDVAGRRVGAVLLAGGHDHVRTGGGQPLTDGQPDPPRSAGDDRGAPAQIR